MCVFAVVFGAGITMTIGPPTADYSITGLCVYKIKILMVLTMILILRILSPDFV